MLSMIARSPMVHVQVPETCIHFSFMYTAYYILPVLTIKEFIKKYGDPTTPFKLATDMKPSISYLRVLFFQCVIIKSTANVGKNSLNMCHQAQKFFAVCFVGIPQNQKVYFVCVPNRREIFYSYNVFLMIVSLVLWHTRHNHMNNLWLCDRLCSTYFMLHLQGKELAI